jgi:hypothetical protein
MINLSNTFKHKPIEAKKLLILYIGENIGLPRLTHWQKPLVKTLWLKVVDV